MVDVAQLVRAPVCGTGGRGFKSRHPPQLFFPTEIPAENFILIGYFTINYDKMLSQISPTIELVNNYYFW